MRSKGLGHQGAVFPIHREPYLDEFLKRRESKRMRTIIADALAESDSCDMDAIVDELVVPPISIREMVATSRTWNRQMRMGPGDFPSVRQGIYPGDSYKHTYQVYDLALEGSMDLVCVGVNGGHPLDPMFV